MADQHYVRLIGFEDIDHPDERIEAAREQASEVTAWRRRQQSTMRSSPCPRPQHIRRMGDEVYSPAITAQEVERGEQGRPIVVPTNRIRDG
jgi:hypothetical protein